MNTKILETTLIEQKEEFHNNLKINYCTRSEEKLVNLTSKLAQVVIGIRRCGKSTLCLNVIKKSNLKFAYVNFDDERLQGITSDDLNTILQYLYKLYGDFTHLFIDEIQNVRGWSLFVNRLLRTGMHILMTGSNAKLLSGELATYLTGRHMTIELYPFSFSEYCNFKKINIAHATTKEKGMLSAAFDSYIIDGGLPELFDEPRKQSYISNLTRNILTNDIENRYRITFKDAFEKIVNHLLNNAPTTINYIELKNLFGLGSDHTVENYVNYAKNAYIICTLDKFSYKSKLRIHGQKAYATDISFMNNRENAMSGANLGWRLETIVYIELLRRFRPHECDIYYYKESSGEADFLVCKGKHVQQIIQVCYDISNIKTRKREIKGLLLAAEKTGCNELLIITYDEDDIIEKDGKKINIVPAFIWLVEE